MSKEQIIDAIRRQNQSAAVAFLDSFDEQTLQSYLRRLALVGGRGRSSVWIREGCSSAIVTRLN